MQTKHFGLCAALSAAALLLLAGCAGSGSTAAPTLTVESSYPLQYAKQFTVDECTGGYELITIADSQYLVVPQGAAVPEDLPQGTTVLQQPIENIYLVSTSAMDPIISLGALDSIALSGTKADGWYLPEAKAAMQAGQIAYAGKYSAPDYETILASGCGLAIENTMIYHTPEVKEQLEKFGIPVLVERSSYETDPLARMEWVKLYGILLGKQQEAEQLFETQVQRVAPLENQQPTGKTVAFFSITSNNLVTVRKGSDYVARMIEMAGGSYVFVQRWEHNLKQLNRMSVHDQEMMIGRTKEANEEIDGDERPETSHLTRVDLKEDGKGLKIVRQSLPYGTASGTHGLYFCAYCARLHNIEQQLLSMFGDTDGKRDAMLRFTKPVTGGYYFAPSLDKLMAL